MLIAGGVPVQAHGERAAETQPTKPRQTAEEIARREKLRKETAEFENMHVDRIREKFYGIDLCFVFDCTGARHA